MSKASAGVVGVVRRVHLPGDRLPRWSHVPDGDAVVHCGKPGQWHGLHLHREGPHGCGLVASIVTPRRGDSRGGGPPVGLGSPPCNRQILVSMDGKFSWGRTSRKTNRVYVEIPAGSVRSNTVVIRSR